MNWENYQNAYQKASTEMQELLDSEKIPLCVKNSLEKRELLLLRKKAAAETAAYTVGSQTIDETIRNLTQIGITDALQFIAEIQTCTTQSTVASPTTRQPDIHLQAEISNAEKELASLQTVRTMSHDMAAIKPGSDVVYQSSQADILATQPPAATPLPPQPPRWETDNKQ